ncbi:MAG: hypothetical protein KKB63_12450, partial [Alphaproteobacteria bacterium]|nr:hypothetical protein [Alphaproteobacteria bacterium]
IFFFFFFSLPYSFPSDAAIALDAYRSSTGTGMRFDCGTVADTAIPELLVLDEIDDGGNVLFRLKVIETYNSSGRILGSADRVQPKSDDNNNQKSLFPVVYRELKDEIWKVDVNYEQRPALVLNSEIPGIRHRVRHDTLLQGLLFPAAFRIVLENMVRDDDDGDDDAPSWRTDWLQFCRDTLGITEEPPVAGEEARREWIDYAVRRLCEEFQFMKGIRKLEEGVSWL